MQEDSSATDSDIGQKKAEDRLRPKALRAYRTVKRAVLSGVRLRYERFKEFFKLPQSYRANRARKDCDRSRAGLTLDLLTWFFSYRTLPVHYGRCRIWELDKSEWKYYFGSNYRSLHDARLKKLVWPAEYRVVFDDKFVCGLLCQALGIRTPRIYGVLDPARDYRSRLSAWLAESPEPSLIIKPLRGQSGRDIVLAEKGGEGIAIRSEHSLLPLDQFILRERAIAQEVVIQHRAMAAFSSASVNTLRVVTLMTRTGQVIIVNAAMRTGVGSAFVDNWAAGGVAAGIDCRTGRLRAVAYDKKGRRYAVHPTSGVVFADYPIPGWDLIRAAAVAIQELFPFYRMLGLDLAIEPNGEPVLIEINYAPDFTFLEQTGGPVLKMEAVLRAFGEYDLLVNKHQRKLYDALDRPPLD